MALTPGTRLGVYQIREKIGEGGMGQVYQAHDTTLDRDVAIKVLPEAFAHDADRLARFLREARTLASLNHPNIAIIHGLEESGGVRALVMELVEGPTLADRIGHASGGPEGPPLHTATHSHGALVRRGGSSDPPGVRGLSIDEALPIAKQIAEALEAAHGQGVIHRDLKPANIKVRPDGTVKVLDFGLAKAMDPSAVGRPFTGRQGGPADPAYVPTSQMPTMTSPAMMTGAGMILGTAAYMSPEQAKGQTVDRRTDIWAFGCVLYEMLTGTRAFGGDDVQDTFIAIMRDEPDWTRLPTTLPPALGTYIRRCLHKNPTQRIGDVQDVRLALEGAFETAAPVDVVDATPARATASWAGRLGWVAAAALASSTALLGARLLQPAPVPEVTRFQIVAPAGSRLPLQTPSPSPDGRTLAYTVADASGTRRIHLRRLDRVETTVLPGTEDAVHPFWSPDGRFLAFVSLSDKNVLRQVAIDSSASRAMVDGVNGPWHGDWGMSGDILGQFVGDGIRRVSAQGGGDSQPVLPDVSHPMFLPDGRRFLFRDGRADGTSIGLGTVGSTDTKVVLSGVDSAPLLAILPVGGAYLMYLQQSNLVAREFDSVAGTVGGEPVVVVPNVARVASPNVKPSVGVSRTGVLAFQEGGEGGARLESLDRAGVNRGTVPVPGLPESMAFSPDGSRVATRQGSDLWVTDVARGVSRRLTTSGGVVGGGAWSPDGKRLAFSRGGQIVATDAGGGEEVLIGPRGLPPSWSSQGFLVLERLVLKFVPYPSRSQPVELGQGYQRGRGRLSPDGRYAAFESLRSGRSEIYLRSVTPGADLMQVSANGGRGPHWRGDGKELFFRRGNEITAVDVVLGDTIAVGVPRVLFAVPTGMSATDVWDVDPSGQRFLFAVVDARAADNPITVVTNWWAALAR